MELRKKTFPQVVKGDYKVLYRVFPAAQQLILDVLENLKCFENLRLILFGSATTYCFDADSDIDLAIEVLDRPLTVELQCAIDRAIWSALYPKREYDAVWINHLLDSPLKREIEKTGFVIREK